MSEFRIFCIAMFSGLGFGAASSNRHWLRPGLDGAEGVLLIGLLFGCLAVAFLGRKAA